MAATRTTLLKSSKGTTLETARDKRSGWHATTHNRKGIRLWRSLSRGRRRRWCGIRPKRNWRFPVMFAPLSVKFVQLFVKHFPLLKILVSLVKHQSRARVLDRVMCIRLNVLMEHKPRKETKWNATLSLSQEVKVHSIYHLLRGNVYVDDSKIFGKNL